MRERIRRGRQRQRQRTPEDVERGEEQQAEDAATQEHAIRAEQRERGADQLRIAQRRSCRGQHGEPPPSHETNTRHHGRGRQIDASPSEQIRDTASPDARQQQSDDHAALRGAHHAPAFMRCRGVGRVRQDALRHRRAQRADEHHRPHQLDVVARHRDCQQREHETDQLQSHQARPGVPVTQRDDQQQSQYRPDLRRRHDRADRGGRHVEVHGQTVEQRLGQIDVGHAHSARDGEQHELAPGHRA